MVARVGRSDHSQQEANDQNYKMGTIELLQVLIVHDHTTGTSAITTKASNHPKTCRSPILPFGYYFVDERDGRRGQGGPKNPDLEGKARQQGWPPHSHKGHLIRCDYPLPMWPW